MSEQVDPLDPSPYTVLNVPQDAQLPAIRCAHRKLVLSCHPDKIQDESLKKVKAEQFHQVQHAYEVLSDEKRRQDWDDRAKRAAERVKLAELRAEVAEERTRAARTAARPHPTPEPPRRSASEYIPPPQRSASFAEFYGTVPRYDDPPRRARTYEEDAFAAAFSSSKQSDQRPSNRRYESRTMNTPTRKASGRGQPDDSHRSNEAETTKERQKRVKEEEAALRDQRNRRRDRDRRRASEARFHSRTAHFESGGSSDSDEKATHTRSSHSTRRGDELRSHETSPRMPTSSWSTRGHDKADTELDRKVFDVRDYMAKTRITVDPEPQPRKSRRAHPDSIAEQFPAAPPPPPSAPPLGRSYTSRRTSVDEERRASVSSTSNRAPKSASTRRDRQHSTSGLRTPSPSPRIPSMPVMSSDPRGLHGRSASSRQPDFAAPSSSTPKKTSSRFSHPGLRRAETMPTTPIRRNEPAQPPSSRLKHMKISGDTDSSSFSDPIFEDESTDNSDSDDPRLRSSRRRNPDGDAKEKRRPSVQHSHSHSQSQAQASPPRKHGSASKTTYSIRSHGAVAESTTPYGRGYPSLSREKVRAMC